MKKAWEKPQLVVLVRGKPEESVLVTCKKAGGFGAPSSPTICDNCETPRPS